LQLQTSTVNSRFIDSSGGMVAFSVKKQGNFLYNPSIKTSLTFSSPTHAFGHEYLLSSLSSLVQFPSIFQNLLLEKIIFNNFSSIILMKIEEAVQEKFKMVTKSNNILFDKIEPNKP
jgi:hypothetical protein